MIVMVHMGKIIRQLRKQQNMTQEKLGNGIVSKSVISRIENDIVEPDLMVLEALFQRLGKSLNPFEIVVSNREFELLKAGEYAAALQTTVIAEGDIVKDIREAKGLSQEKFSSDIYSRETISNIEHGRTPRRKKIKNLLEKQGESFKRYYGYVVTEEYEVYELVEQYQKIAESNPEEAKKLRRKIRDRINREHPVNQQFLESSELFEKRREGRITYGEELAGLERCLRLTMPEYDGMLYRIPHRQEVLIIDEIVTCMEAVQRRTAAQSLAEEMKKKQKKKIKFS